MPLITKPDFTYVWASGGAIVAPNDTKKQLGWVAEAPPFQWDNWLQNRQDQMLAHINQRGIPAWDGLTNYEAGGLSYVQGSDGKVYKSVAASGPASVVSNPTTDVTDTYWTVAFADVGAFLTQAAGDVRYTQRTNNLSDLTNTATARANLGVSAAVVAGISGSFSNLKASATGLSAIVTTTADSICLKDSSNNQVVVNSVSITPSLATSGANGLDTGVSAINTWYAVWVIWNGTTTAGLLSLSATAPTMPGGYTHKARVGAVRTDGTANKYPLSYTQFGNSARYKVAAGSNVTAPPVMSSGAVTWPAAVAVGAFVPPTASHINLSAYLLAISTAAYVAPNAAYAQLDSPIAQASSGTQGGTFSTPMSMLLESTNIYYGSGASTKLLCFGWEDNL